LLNFAPRLWRLGRPSALRTELQLAVDIDGLVFHHRAFARLALDGVGLRRKAVYTHNVCSVSVMAV
jgi:hypothetical protein